MIDLLTLEQGLDVVKKEEEEKEEACLHTYLSINVLSMQLKAPHSNSLRLLRFIIKMQNRSQEWAGLA